VSAAKANAAFLAEIAEIYRAVDSEIQALSPTCFGGGTCCKFDLAGHRLYLSTGELALLSLQPPPIMEQAPRLRCPYQTGPRCNARQNRPLGCRVYFCTPELASAIPPIYEKYHQHIRQLHAIYAIEYRYVELTNGLCQLFSNSRTDNDSV